jgi:pimeloyl-ACP methyl ester carboxylesterase
MAACVTAPERLGRTRLPDGRAMGWAEWGPESGRPVLLCAGSATSRWLGLHGSAVVRLGVRLITVDRPGLGVSDAAARWTLQDWTRDVRAFAGSRGLADLAAIGYSVGAPFALACAAAGAVVGVSVVSGTDELAHPTFEAALEAEVSMLVRRVADDPGLAEKLLAHQAGPEELWEVVTGTGNSADRGVYTDPAFDAAYRRALAEGFSQGPGGYARETVLAVSPWPFDPSEITVPVDLWYSEQDTNPFHSPDLGASLAARTPTARRHLLADAGTALLWTHTDRIVRSLLDRTPTS